MIMKNDYLREADTKDVDLLFEWANDITVRKNSFNIETISYEDHIKWFEYLLKDALRKQYIYIVDDIPTGQVRVTKINENSVEIGYSVAADYRGMGYGKRMLQLVYEKIKIYFPEVDTVIARVKAENISSQKVFEATGFKAEYIEFQKNINVEEDK